MGKVPTTCGSCLYWSAAGGLRLSTACCCEIHWDTASTGFALARASLLTLVLMEAGEGRGPQSRTTMSTVR